MPLIAGCRLHVDETATTVAHSLEQARRLAIPYIHNRQAVKLEICVTSRPTQVWAYDYDTSEWVLQK